MSSPFRTFSPSDQSQLRYKSHRMETAVSHESVSVGPRESSFWNSLWCWSQGDSTEDVSELVRDEVATPLCAHATRHLGHPAVASVGSVLSSACPHSGREGGGQERAPVGAVPAVPSQ